MHIKINRKKIPIYIKTTFKDKLVSLRFKLDEINYGLCFPKKRRINTYLFCQQIDIIMTDKNNKILNIFKNASSENFYKGQKGTYYTYIFPLGVSDYYVQGDILDVVLELRF